MSEQPAKALTMTLILGSVLVIGIGLAVAIAGQWWGWLIAGFGALDAAAIPFVLRAVGAKRAGDADSSYNPYARED